MFELVFLVSIVIVLTDFLSTIPIKLVLHEFPVWLVFLHSLEGNTDCPAYRAVVVSDFAIWTINVTFRDVPFLGSGADFGPFLVLVPDLVLNEERFGMYQRTGRTDRKFYKNGTPIIEQKSLD